MELMSPKYKTHLIKEIAESIWREFKSYQEVLIYIQSWHHTEPGYDSYFENFEIVYRDLSKLQVDLLPTLANMDAETVYNYVLEYYRVDKDKHNNKDFYVIDSPDNNGVINSQLALQFIKIQHTSKQVKLVSGMAKLKNSIHLILKH